MSAPTLLTSLFLLSTLCFPVSLPTCTVTKLSVCSETLSGFPLPGVQCLHGIQSMVCPLPTSSHGRGPSNLTAIIQSHWFPNMSSTFILCGFAYGHPYPELSLISSSHILESFRLSSNDLFPGKFFLITLIQVRCFPCTPETFGLCLFCSTDYAPTHSGSETLSPLRAGTMSCCIVHSCSFRVEHRPSTCEQLHQYSLSYWVCKFGSFCTPDNLKLLFSSLFSMCFLLFKV